MWASLAVIYSVVLIMGVIQGKAVAEGWFEPSPDVTVQSMKQQSKHTA